MQVTSRDIKKEARFYMKSPTLEAQCAEDDFQIQLPTSAVNFLSSMSNSG